MSHELEFSAGPRGISTFPPHWGPPPGRRFSERRAGWVKANVAADLIIAGREHELRDGLADRSAASALARVRKAMRRT